MEWFETSQESTEVLLGKIYKENTGVTLTEHSALRHKIIGEINYRKDGRT